MQPLMINTWRKGSPSWNFAKWPFNKQILLDTNTNLGQAAEKKKNNGIQNVSERKEKTIIYPMEINILIKEKINKKMIWTPPPPYVPARRALKAKEE